MSKPTDKPVARREDYTFEVCDKADRAIYKATNAQSCGVSRAAPFWVDPSTGRRVSAKATKTRTVAQMKALGYERQVSPGKHCFKWNF